MQFARVEHVLKLFFHQTMALQELESGKSGRDDAGVEMMAIAFHFDTLTRQSRFDQGFDLFGGHGDTLI